MKRWIEIEARLAEPPEDWSLFADAFTRHGCASSMVSTDECGLLGHLEELDGAEARVGQLSDSLRGLGAAVKVRVIEDQDWSEVWKKHFRPRRIGRRLLIVPSWETVERAEGDLAIVLDPGQAFGTGEHPTTQLCLELLEDVPSGEPPRSALDLGCGSGVLAIGAAKLGFDPVTAADIEEAAVAIARSNAERNEVRLEAYAGDGFGTWAAGRTWDVVLSNIISATLIRLAPEAFAYVSPGGHWIVSGILEPNWTDVRAASEAAGFSLVRTQNLDGWVGAVFARPK